METVVNWAPEMMLEITLQRDDSFLIAMETLKRMGMSNPAKEGEDKDTLYQSCHILHKSGRYYLMHFREMYALDGKTSEIPEIDLMRRNGIALALEKWNIITIVNKDMRITDDNHTLDHVRIISHKDKKNFNLKTMYQMGVK